MTGANLATGAIVLAIALVVVICPSVSAANSLTAMPNGGNHNAMDSIDATIRTIHAYHDEIAYFVHEHHTVAVVVYPYALRPAGRVAFVGFVAARDQERPPEGAESDGGNTRSKEAAQENVPGNPFAGIDRVNRDRLGRYLGLGPERMDAVDLEIANSPEAIAIARGVEQQSLREEVAREYVRTHRLAHLLPSEKRRKEFADWVRKIASDGANLYRPVEVTLSEEDYVSDGSRRRYVSAVARIEDGWLAICYYRSKDGTILHSRHDLLLSPDAVPTKHLNEFGEERVRVAGHLFTEPQALEYFRRICPGALPTRALAGYVRQLNPGDPITEALRLVVDLAGDRWSIVVPEDTPNPVTKLLVDAYRPGDAVAASRGWERYRPYIVTDNQRVTACYAAASPVYQALMGVWASEPILPWLDRRGITKSGKTTDVASQVNVLWGLRPTGIGGDFEASGFRQQELMECSNLPVQLDESQGTRKSQERRRHGQSGGTSGRGRSDRTMDWSHSIMPGIVTSNRPQEDAGSENEYGANERRTISLVDTVVDKNAVERRSGDFQKERFHLAPGGHVLHLLRGPGNSPREVVKWLEGQESVDPRQLIVDLGARLLGIPALKLPELTASSPGAQFLQWLEGAVAQYYATQVRVVDRFETRVPVHPELREIMSVKNLDGKEADGTEDVVDVRVTLPLVMRYAREMRSAGKEPAYTSPHLLADLGPLTGQTPWQIWPTAGWKRDVGGRNQVHAVVRLRKGGGAELNGGDPR